ncbi:MAG: SpoVR family protein [Acidobacteria bacterium]|nr:SpoVR family protein [Acidobacteriota bacterium]
MSDPERAVLEDAISEIWDKALGMGLDPYPMRFEIVPASVMYEIGSYSLPGRYSHWTFGKAYHKMKLMYDLGLSKIYEIVINTNPAYAFLLDGNSLVQNRMIVSHVLAHVDFFKNNAYFGKTNRRMLDEVSTHAEQIRQFEFRHGRHRVEALLDAVLSIQEHIDPYFFIKDVPEEAPSQRPERGFPSTVGRFDDLLTSEERKAASEEEHRQSDSKPAPAPEKDLVYYLAKNSPTLEPWEGEVIAMIHDEMEYFIPQMQTKIMNEGWASYWHSRIMRALDLPDEDFVEYAQLHSGVLAPRKGSLNPYYLGFKIFEEIERRWNEPTRVEQDRFGRAPGQGREKIFEVRELDSDISFLRNYLTRELVEDLDLYVFELKDEEEWVITEKTWEHVRDHLVADMTNFGHPYIEVASGDYQGNRELLLRHRHEGSDLDLEYARRTLEHVQRLWGRTVHLSTIADGEKTILSYDGKEHRPS